MNKFNILITGGTGLIGKALSKLLENNGYNVAVLTRRKNAKELRSFYWNYENGILDNSAIEFADVIIHLAGENIANKRWTKKQKQRIINSRVKTTNLLFSKTEHAKSKPHTFISVSAVGYYGTETSDNIYCEEDKPGNDFLAKTAVRWENSVDQFSKAGIRTVKLRTGIVLSMDGGSLLKMLAPVKLGLGAPLGSGKQYIPWIGINDLARMFLFVMEKEESAPVYNAVAPNHVNNHDFMKTLADSLNKPFFLPGVPAFILKIIFGEMSDILLKGNRVSSEKIRSAGFTFNYTDIKDILTEN